jgi:hypothetical protein
MWLRTEHEEVANSLKYRAWHVAHERMKLLWPHRPHLATRAQVSERHPECTSNPYEFDKGDIALPALDALQVRR